MCYAGGPYCSNVARKKYIKAQSLSRINANFDTIAAEQQAKEDFYMTPAGMRELERLINIDENAEKNQLLLDYAKVARAEAMARHKHKDIGDTPHSISYTDGLEERTELFTLDTADSHRVAWNMLDNEAELVSNYVEASARWVDKLSPEEVSAVRWFTSNGFHEMGQYDRNEHISESYNDTETQEEKRARILRMRETLTSALAKSDDTPKVVYRGISGPSLPEEIRYEITDKKRPYLSAQKQYASQEEYDEKVTEYLAKLMEQGEVSFERPISTAANSSVATAFAGRNAFGSEKIIYEFSTKTGAAAGIASAWGASEAEYIIPENTKYKIIGIQRNVTFDSKNKRGEKYSRTATVIQLSDY
jgi:hypothetical protein